MLEFFDFVGKYLDMAIKFIAELFNTLNIIKDILLSLISFIPFPFGIFFSFLALFFIGMFFVRIVRG
jgi:hypothetical protein